MDFHGFANTEHALELRLSSSSSKAANFANPIKKPNLNSDHSLEPSLTLALSGDSCGGSSFSNTGMERKREIAIEESKENPNGEEDDGFNGKKRLRLTQVQSELLEEAFRHHTSLNPKQKQELARDLKLRPRKVEIWARTKLKQIGMDCKYLEKCCKTLTDENQRLRQLVQELRTQKAAQHVIQLPPATLIVCPSCDQIGDTNSAATKSHYVMDHYPYSKVFTPFNSPVRRDLVNQS